MKTTCDWLKEYCDVDASPQEVAEMLTMAGLEVEDLTDLGADWLLEAEVTTNRPDWLGVIGVARELHALTGVPLVLPPTDFREGGEPIEAAASVVVEDPDLCPRYTARLIRGVKVAPSPPWLIERLAAIGLRPVNNIVDITNLVLFESCQPLHAFDFDLLDRGRVVVRRAREGESIVAIDGSEHELKPDYLVIADAHWPVAVAGVMGGKDSEINDSATNVLLESACFDPANNRATSRALGLFSDSSYRFERGVDPVNADWASRRAARLIQEVCGGEVAPGVIDVWADPWKPRRVTMRVARMNALLGLDIAPERAAEVLEALGIKVVRQDAEIIEAEPPSFRADLTREADLIEEVIRIHGLDKVPVATTLKIVAARKSDAETAIESVRQMLVGAGHYETLTISFQNEADSRLVSPWTDAAPLTFNNVVRRDEDRLRVSIMPEMLRVLRTNEAHGVPEIKAFEIAKVYLPVEGQALPEERFVLTLLREDDPLDLKGVIESVLDVLRVSGDVVFRPWAHPFFAEGTAAEILLDGTRLGVMGQASKPVADAFDLTALAYLAEMDFDRLVQRADFVARHEPLPAFPASARDLAVVVDEGVSWADLEGRVRSVDVPILESIEFLNIYRGKPVAEGRKSVAFRMVFRAPDRTLTREEVEERRDDVFATLREAFGAELRT